MGLLYFLFPWVVLVVLNFLIQPIALYIGGKILRINNPKFKFLNCVWINFIAALFASFAGGINIFLGLAVYVLLLGYLMKKEFLLTAKTLTAIIVIMLGISIALSYLQQILVLQVLTISAGSNASSMTISPTTPDNTQTVVLPSEDVCKLLSNEKATQILGVAVHGYSASFNSSCVYRNDKKENYLYLTFYRTHSDLQEKEYYLHNQYSKWNVQSHDEIQKDAFLAEQNALMKVFFMVNNKHYSIERSNSQSRLITDKVLLSLTKAILEDNQK